jgi:hypothetical protein
VRLLLAAVLVAAAAWSAIWWFGARAAKRDLIAWLDARHDAGWVANYDAVTTGGYPNRFDTEIQGLELVDTQAGLAWRAPFLQLFRLSYQPRHVIVVWPDAQSLAVPGARIEITSTDARGSFVFGRGADWPLERANMTFEGVTLRSDAGWQASASTGRLATRPSERVAGAVDIGLVLSDFTPAHPGLAALADQGVAPGTVSQLSVDAAVRFDAPWDRRAIEDGRPLITAIDLGLAKMTWGAAELWAAGDVTLDESGRPSGEITVKLTNWRDLLVLAKQAGLPSGLADALEGGLQLLSGMAGASETLDVPLTLRAGRASFGPIPLGSITLFQPR